MRPYEVEVVDDVGMGMPMAGLVLSTRPVGMTGRQIGVAVLDYPGIAGRPQQASHHGARSEEHTYELQSLMRITYAGLCLKKKTTNTTTNTLTSSPHLGTT